MYRHYVSCAPACPGCCETLCGLPVVADAGRVKPGVWEPAYRAEVLPSYYAALPLCRECGRKHELQLELAKDGSESFDMENDGDGRAVFGPVLPPLDAYEWPGGYLITYYVKGPHSNSRGFDGDWCAACASWERDCGDEVIGNTYDEGPIVECENCNCRLISSYGDPECWACDGDVNGLRNDGTWWECPLCANAEASWLWWMRANIERHERENR